MSSSLSMNCGSLESLKVLTRCGLRPCSRQIRATAVALVPRCAARLRVLHCVELLGRSSSVTRTTSATWVDMRAERGRPGRVASCNSPATPSTRKRARQRATKRRSVSSLSAISLSWRPLAASKTMRARNCTRASTRLRLERARSSRSSWADNKTGLATRMTMTSLSVIVRQRIGI